ncbi:hypothetical protein [Peterkaempfera sp. SMS 1(5)a]|uniref:hypothetical protein n=1 Tax=Peterkaempfera podocarpi TaxID=3232308 RepID=UPI003670181A
MPSEMRPRPQAGQGATGCPDRVPPARRDPALSDPPPPTDRPPPTHRPVHHVDVTETGSFCTARCSCGWYAPARRSRDRARRDAAEHSAG